jgi:hypothetical protein
MLPVDSVYGAWPASGEIDVSPLFLYSTPHTAITPLSDDSGDATHSYLNYSLILMIPFSHPCYQIMEARGNGIDYRGQGVNYVRSSLNYGPMSSVLARLFGWQSEKRIGYDAAFHTYTLEWTDKWMRISVDNRVNAMIDLNVAGKGQSFW